MRALAEDKRRRKRIEKITTQKKIRLYTDAEIITVLELYRKTVESVWSMSSLLGVCIHIK